MKQLTVGSTFTGIGGADLGFEWAGFDIKWQCEFDSWKQEVLRAHWADVPLYDDITTMNDAPSVDVMLGGFPCQDLSVAGKRKGFGGERSVLAFEFLRVAELVQPRWIVLENVPGLLSSNGGRDFARLVDEVVGCGYGVAWRILDARYFGVPQRRRRVFIVARRTDTKHDSRGASRLALRALFESSGGDTSSGWQAWTETTRSVGASSEECGSVGTHGRVDETPTGTLTRMYSEQSGQDFGGGGRSDRDCITIAFGAGQENREAGALTKRYGKGINTTCDDGAIIAFYPTGGSQNGFWDESGVSPTIKVGSGVGASNGIAIVNALDRQQGGADDNSAQAGHLIAETTTQPIASTLTRGGHPNSNAPGRRREDDENLVGQQMSVRRLTPVECERLMGLPDGWTAPSGVKAPDSKRYAACGDAIVTTVAFWIADRIRMIEEEEMNG